MKIFLLILSILYSGFSYADPWGKDADLCHHTSPCLAQQIPTPFIGGISELLISFHQNVISPADGPRSNFFPSSSQYTLDAMRQYGFFEGFLLGCDRLMRENSEEWIYPQICVGRYTLKYDPVR